MSAQNCIQFVSDSPALTHRQIHRNAIHCCSKRTMPTKRRRDVKTPCFFVCFFLFFFFLFLFFFLFYFFFSKLFDCWVVCNVFYTKTNNEYPDKSDD